MKTVVVYFKATDDAGPPAGKAEYLEAYTMFAKTVSAKGGQLLVVRGSDSYLDGARFSNGWKLVGDTWEECGECSADIVFVKDRDFPKGVNVNIVNSWEFEELCSEKDKTVALFPDVFPKTVVVGGEPELDSALAQIDGEMIVAKPVDGACGRDVYVGPRTLLDRASQPYPILLQECIDMSQGVPGHCTGVHDLRIIFVGGEVALCTLRTPAEGSLIANVSQGGSIKLIPKADIPSGALAVAMDIDQRLQMYPDRVYSVDMGLHRGTLWKVIELNAPPGLTPPKWGSEVMKYFDMLASHLLKMAA